MGSRYKVGDKVYVPDKKMGFGDARGTVTKVLPHSQYEVFFKGLPKKTSVYIGRDGKKKRLKLGPTGTYILVAGNLRKKR